MAKLLNYIKLLRPQQYYKNLMVFLAIFFVNQFFTKSIIPVIAGFFSLCAISSVNYIINDIIDIKKDRQHPEKKHRPLASKKVSIPEALIIATILLIISIIIAINLSQYFFYSVLALLILTQIYSLFLKNILFADILTIATNFVIRSVAGAFIINVMISPWLILCPFFFAIFLASGKRHANLLFLKDKAKNTKKVLKKYTLELTNSLMLISTTLLIISYTLYAFLSNTKLLITLPFTLFVIFQYFSLVQKGSAIARNPEKIIYNKELMIGTVILITLLFTLMYL